MGKDPRISFYGHPNPPCAAFRGENLKAPRKVPEVTSEGDGPCKESGAQAGLMKRPPGGKGEILCILQCKMVPPRHVPSTMYTHSSTLWLASSSSRRGRGGGLLRAYGGATGPGGVSCYVLTMC